MWVTDFWTGPTGKSFSLYLAKRRQEESRENVWTEYSLKDGSPSQ